MASIVTACMTEAACHRAVHVALTFKNIHLNVYERVFSVGALCFSKDTGVYILQFHSKMTA